jgi:hypothetical protein
MPSGCPYCKVVNAICYWGPRPYAKWKRWVLLACAVPFAVSVPAALWLFGWTEVDMGTSALLAPLFLLGILGVLVATHGCDACVARMFGEL